MERLPSLILKGEFAVSSPRNVAAVAICSGRGGNIYVGGRGSCSIRRAEIKTESFRRVKARCCLKDEHHVSVAWTRLTGSSALVYISARRLFTEKLCSLKDSTATHLRAKTYPEDAVQLDFNFSFMFHNMDERGPSKWVQKIFKSHWLSALNIDTYVSVVYLFSQLSLYRGLRQENPIL